MANRPSRLPIAGQAPRPCVCEENLVRLQGSISSEILHLQAGFPPTRRPSMRTTTLPANTSWQTKMAGLRRNIQAAQNDMPPITHRGGVIPPCVMNLVKLLRARRTMQHCALVRRWWFSQATMQNDAGVLRGSLSAELKATSRQAENPMRSLLEKSGSEALARIARLLQCDMIRDTPRFVGPKAHALMSMSTCTRDLPTSFLSPCARALPGIFDIFCRVSSSKQ